MQEVDYPGGTWRRKGAEEKKAQVYAWRQEHPEGRKACLLYTSHGVGETMLRKMRKEVSQSAKGKKPPYISII